MEKGNMFYGWKIVAGLVIMLAILVPASVALANLYQISVTNEFGISNSSFALNNSVLQLMGVFFSPLVSRLLMKDFKKNFIIGILLYALTYASYGLAPNIYVFYLLSIISGITFQMVTVIPAGMLINNWFVEKRGLAISIAFTGFSVGGVILSPILTNMIQTLGWRNTYFAYAALMLIISLPIALFVIKVKPADMGLQALGAENARVDASAGNVSTNTNVKLPMKDVFNKPFFIALMVGTVAVGVACNAGFGQFPPFLQGLYGPEVAAIVISTYSLAGIFGKLILGTFNDKFGIKASIVYCMTGLIATYVLMAGAAMMPGAVGFAFIAAVAFGLSNALGSILGPLITSKIFAPQHYAIAYGYVNSAMQIGMTVSSLIVAFIADATGAFTASWLVIIAFVLVSGGLWLVSLKSSLKYA